MNMDNYKMYRESNTDNKKFERQDKLCMCGACGFDTHTESYARSRSGHVRRTCSGACDDDMRAATLIPADTYID